MEKIPVIRFGTSGWRAVIAEDFTADNVRLVSAAIAGFLKAKNAAPRVVVGYDTRFMSDYFARECARVLSACGVGVLLTRRDTPTPVISFEIINRGLNGAVNFTASHNPPEYNGIKFSPGHGGPAAREITAAIERNIQKLRRSGLNLPRPPVSSDEIELIEPRREYCRHLSRLVDLNAVRRARLNIAVDCMFGTSRGYLDEMLAGVCRKIIVFHNRLNPRFGGHPPEPAREYILHLVRTVKQEKFHLGLACDGDADRFGIVDSGGTFLTPNEIFPLLFYFLIKTRGKSARVARTLATTHMIDAIAEKEGMEVVETPVGFKYIGEVLRAGGCLIGGEESGGLSIQGHVPEKDGILACLLTAEMAAREKKTLKSLLASLYAAYGRYYSDRIDLRLTPANKEKLWRRLASWKGKKDVFGIAVRKRDFRDGLKFVFARDFWLMFRASGTEPVLRCYLEAGSRKNLALLRSYVRRFVVSAGRS